MQTRIASLTDARTVVQITEESGDPIGWSSTGARLFYRDAAAIWSVDVSDSGPLLATRRVAFRLPRDLVGTPAVRPGGQQAILIRGGAIYSDLVVRQGVLTGR
ncbi:MAG: SMP-30/gluconolactonase/LRE family protein [Acidobacteriota bacterium]|nr:SMP-30/gluconolactonase/LRE family protein [Acidobacteriota bacterium]